MRRSPWEPVGSTWHLQETAGYEGGTQWQREREPAEKLGGLQARLGDAMSVLVAVLTRRLASE